MARLSKYPKLFVGDVILIDDVAYMVKTGLSQQQREQCNRRENNKFVYNVSLRSVIYNPDKYPEYIYCKNTEMKPFVKV